MSDDPRGPLPRVADVVAELRRVLDEDGRAEPGGVLGLLVALHRTNAAQWALEDDVRAPAANDTVIATAKRAIDRLNADRHRHVEEVDRAIDHVLTQAVAAPPTTESPAMAFDRLSVLVIRIHHTERAARSAHPGDGDYGRRLPHLHAQLATLEAAIEVLLDDVVSGTRRFEPYKSLKLYGS